MQLQAITLERGRLYKVWFDAVGLLLASLLLRALAARKADLKVLGFEARIVDFFEKYLHEDGFAPI